MEKLLKVLENEGFEIVESFEEYFRIVGATYTKHILIKKDWYLSVSLNSKDGEIVIYIYKDCVFKHLYRSEDVDQIIENVVNELNQA